MNRQIISLCLLTVLISAAGCKHEQPAHTVILVDVSKSITPDGVNFEFKAVDDVVDKMNRGDSLTLIPITGNALTDTSGHILRFHVPAQREPYDHDLAAFRRKAHEQIQSLRNATLIHPSIRTDILGTLELVGKEFASDVENDQLRCRLTLVILSDFVEDEDTYRFAFDPALASDTTARALAEQLQKGSHLALSGASIHLSTVDGTDLRRLTPKRQKAIRAFWMDYLSASKGTLS